LVGVVSTLSTSFSFVEKVKYSNEKGLFRISRNVTPGGILVDDRLGGLKGRANASTNEGTTPMSARTVSVLGLGWMGTAIATTLVREGHTVTVWNRTVEKTTPFIGRTQIAPTVLAAVEASDIVFVCVLNYEVADEMLRTSDVTGAISGKSLVQFSSGTPERTREAGRWASVHDVSYLDCTMSAGPQHVGTDLGTFFYTGVREVFDDLRDVLAPLIGTSTYCGEQMGYAAALDFAHLGAFTGVLTVLGNVLSLLKVEGVPLEDFLPTLSFLSQEFLDGVVQAITADQYPSGAATLTTWKAWADQFVHSEHDVAIDPRVAELVRDYLALGVERGHGGDDIYAIFSAFGPIG
jgi:3-hydroxyisobutyrate dehydrogenase-like beta-hydroxyacid dehydrogenase